MGRRTIVDVQVTEEVDVVVAEIVGDGELVDEGESREPTNAGSRIVESWLALKTEGTRRAYRTALLSFADFVGAVGEIATIEGIIACTPAQSYEIGCQFRQELEERGLAPATVRRMLSTLMSLAKQAKTLGFIDWTWSIPLPKAVRVRDVRGPGMQALATIQQSLAEAEGPLAARDRAILALLVDLGLRRAEVSGLDLEHVDLDRGVLLVLRKREDTREAVPLAEATAVALCGWIDERGCSAGPLFWCGSGSRVRRGLRLTGQGVWWALRRRSLEAGVGLVRPHAVRHTALSELADRGVPLPQLLRFSGHRSIESVRHYLDHAADRRRELSGVLAERRGGLTPRLDTTTQAPRWTRGSTSTLVADASCSD